MNQLLLLSFIGLGLAMDAFAVAVTSGVTIKNMGIKNIFKIAGLFGFFQALMPLIGWLMGIGMKNYIQTFDHWIAFLILGFLGGKMIYESVWIEEVESKVDYHNTWILIGLAVATSIDALVVGFSISILNYPLWLSVGIIGIITFFLCFGGVFLGKKFGNMFENKIEIIGGVILIGIGTKILIQHLFFS